MISIGRKTYGWAGPEGLKIARRRPKSDYEEIGLPERYREKLRYDARLTDEGHGMMNCHCQELDQLQAEVIPKLQFKGVGDTSARISRQGRRSKRSTSRRTKKKTTGEKA